jgi:hypothetical protein
MTRSSVVLLLSLFAVLPGAAKADCFQWSVAGPWSIGQTNGYTPTFALTQTMSGKIGGTGRYVIPKYDGGFDQGVIGTVAGQVTGNNFTFVVSWGGQYWNSINPDGTLGRGTTADKSNPPQVAAWGVYSGHAACLMALRPPGLGALTPPPPVPVHALGRVYPAGYALGDVDVYAGPDGTKYKVIGVLPSGQGGRILEQRPGWDLIAVHVPLAGNVNSGWIAVDHLAISQCGGYGRRC